MSGSALAEVEDREIPALIAMQEAAGLKVVTDGGARRAFRHYDYMGMLEGLEIVETGGDALGFKRATVSQVPRVGDAPEPGSGQRPGGGVVDAQGGNRQFPQMFGQRPLRHDPAAMAGHGMGRATCSGMASQFQRVSVALLSAPSRISISPVVPPGGHVTALADHTALLRRITDAIYREGEHSDGD